MEFREYFNDNFEELYELYRVVRDIVHGKGLNEEELPEKVRTLTKSRLNKLVNSADSYVKNVYEKIVGDYLKKQEQPDQFPFFLSICFFFFSISGSNFWISFFQYSFRFSSFVFVLKIH